VSSYIGFDTAVGMFGVLMEQMMELIVSRKVIIIFIYVYSQYRVRIYATRPNLSAEKKSNNIFFCASILQILSQNRIRQNICI